MWICISVAIFLLSSATFAVARFGRAKSTKSPQISPKEAPYLGQQQQQQHSEPESPRSFSPLNALAAVLITFMQQDYGLKKEKYKQICVTMWEINCFIHHFQEPPPQPPDDQVPVLRHLLLLLPADDLLRGRPHLLPHRLPPMDAGGVHGRRAKQELQVS